ncbi:hypothetical protein OG432_30320 [Streptomyces sp. NBC_00442]|uniref:hypothetical protein n=1 Tax=Streptomyces sp. NBC_00442 TaxID=2903651 RepID=UPI002E235DA9
MNTAKLLANTSLAAGVVFTATAEYSLARRLGAMEPVSVMLPVAIDAYAITALKRFRPFDIALSLLVMGAAQVAAHLLDSHVMPVNGWLVVVVSLLVPTAIWRTHALARDEVQAPVEAEPHAAADLLPVVDVERVPEPYPAIPAAVPAVPEAVPAGARLLPIVARPVAAERSAARMEPVAVSAAEYARTRPEVHVEYVPDVEPSDAAAEPDRPEDELTRLARKEFADLLDEGRIPAIRQLRDTYSIGQPRAQLIQQRLRLYAD